MRPQASAARAAAMAVVGPGVAGWPTSRWMTRPPAASIRPAAAITSITMNGGTLLRADGTIRRLADSSIIPRPWLAGSQRRPAPLLPYSAASVGRPGQERRQGGYQLAGFSAMGSVSGARGTLTWDRGGRQPRPGRGRLAAEGLRFQAPGNSGPQGFRPNELNRIINSSRTPAAADRSSGIGRSAYA